MVIKYVRSYVISTLETLQKRPHSRRAWGSKVNPPSEDLDSPFSTDNRLQPKMGLEGMQPQALLDHGQLGGGMLATNTDYCLRALASQ